MPHLAHPDNLTDEEYTCPRCDYMGPGEDTGARIACPWCDITMGDS